MTLLSQMSDIWKFNTTTFEFTFHAERWGHYLFEKHNTCRPRRNEF